MFNPDTYYSLLYAEVGIAIVVFIALFFIAAPYGKHLKASWKPQISSSTAWVIMEFPAMSIMPIFFFVNLSEQSLVTGIFLIIWLSHYFYRTLIYPFRTNNPKKPFPVPVMLMGFIFNLMNGYLNAYFLFDLRIVEHVGWLSSGPFVIGLGLFIIGYLATKSSEEILKQLKRGEDGEYSIPHGGLFRFVSNPHYLGELVEWLGWAILTWSSSGLAFFIFTFANLFPRAISNHQWYVKTFPNYPKRKAIIPFLI